MYVDPTGEYGALVGALLGIGSGAIGGAVYGGLIGGAISSAQGGSFWEGAKKGALYGGIAGAAFGGIHGAVMNWGSTPVYQGLTGMGLEFQDLTVALPNTIVGSAAMGIDYFGGLATGLKPTVQRFANQGILTSGGLISSKLEGSVAFTLGNYVFGADKFNPFVYERGLTGPLGLVDINHEFIHIAQQRKFGPLMSLDYLQQSIRSGGLGDKNISWEKIAYQNEKNVLNLIQNGGIFDVLY